MSGSVITSATRRRLRRLLCAVAVSGAVISGGTAAAHATGITSAYCSFVGTGTAGNTGVSPVGVDTPVPTPMDPVLGQPHRNHYTWSGPIHCTGSVNGDDLNDAKHDQAEGTFTADGWDPPDPLSSNPNDTYNACLVVRAPLTVDMRLKGHPLWHGQIDMQTAMFNMALTGDLAGASLIGEAGFGADTEGTQGECTRDKPYVEWEVVGQFSLTGANLKAAGGSPVASPPRPDLPPAPALGASRFRHEVPISGFQYIGGGTVNLFDGVDPNFSFTPARPVVRQGDLVTFTNLDTVPHTVTSCSADDCDPNAPALTVPGEPQSIENGQGAIAGRRTNQCLTPGCADGTFDSEHSLDQLGGSFTVDTTNMTPGKHFYFCEFHRWMRGSFDVLAPGELPKP